MHTHEIVVSMGVLLQFWKHERGNTTFYVFLICCFQWQGGTFDTIFALCKSYNAYSDIISWGFHVFPHGCSCFPICCYAIDLWLRRWYYVSPLGDGSSRNDTRAGPEGWIPQITSLFVILLIPVSWANRNITWQHPCLCKTFIDLVAEQYH